MQKRKQIKYPSLPKFEVGDLCRISRNTRACLLNAKNNEDDVVRFNRSTNGLVAKRVLNDYWLSQGREVYDYHVLANNVLQLISEKYLSKHLTKHIA